MTGLDIWGRWPDVDRLFEEALARPERDRAGFVRDACGPDTVLRDAVLELLETARGLGPEALTPGVAILRAALTDSTVDELEALRPGETVGRYRITSMVGRGGMASVYAAQRADGSYTHRVAVKVLRRGVDTLDVTRRFVEERQILAGLAHPNIARLVDGGATADGRPYLVMEFVDGRPITAHAEAAGLSERARLLLFLQVVDAVAFAHTRLIVHRDIKPSNVLVDEQGRVKLLDFGIAKLLDRPDAAALTRASEIPLTPGFASPEQLGGDAVTTASDVYQLGVLLRLLVEGARGAGSPLRGELAAIVAKATADEPDRRYQSAAALDADVRRHLEGRPVEARPATRRYRLGKFLRRNPWFTPVATVLALLLGGWVATLVRHAAALEAERNEARAQAERASALYGFLTDQFALADPYRVDGADPDLTVVEALELGIRRAEREMAGQPLLQADLLSTMGGVLANLDRRPVALEATRRAIAIRDRAGADRSPAQLADLGALSELYSLLGQVDSARVLAERRLELEREIHGPGSAGLASAQIGLGAIRFGEGRYAEALALYRSATESLEALGSFPAQLARAYSALADAYRNVDSLGPAEIAASRAVAVHEGRFGPDHPGTAEQRAHLAQVLHGAGRLDEAAAAYREALEVMEATLGPTHFNTVNSRNNLGIVLTDAEDYAGAEAVHRRLLEIRRAQTAEGGGEEAVAASLQNLAAVLIRQERFSEADSLAREAERIYRRTRGDADFRVGFALLIQVEAALERGDAGAAVPVAARAAGLLEEALPPGHFATAVARCRLGRARVLAGALGEAQVLLDDALETLMASGSAPRRFVQECGEAAIDVHGRRGHSAEADRIANELARTGSG